MPRLRFRGQELGLGPGQTVLDALLEAGHDIPYSCKNGICQTCLMQVRDGPVPADAQAEIREGLARTGHFLACVCRPEADLEVALPDDADIYGRATVTALMELAPNIKGLRLRPATPLYYRAGQFLNLRRDDGLVRSYSLASVPRLDQELEFHVKRLPRGLMSNWIFDRLGVGDHLDIEGPNGSCFYSPGRAEAPLLLIGNGSGLAPLLGIARDALVSGHGGAIHLYHGSRTTAGHYCVELLAELAATHGNFHYDRCVSGPDVAPGSRAGRAEAVAFADHPDLAGWRVYLCGYPPMVNAARKRAYLAGAALTDIHADPFELRDLRTEPREQ